MASNVIISEKDDPFNIKFDLEAITKDNICDIIDRLKFLYNNGITSIIITQDLTRFYHIIELLNKLYFKTKCLVGLSCFVIKDIYHHDKKLNQLIQNFMIRILKKISHKEIVFEQALINFVVTVNGNDSIPLMNIKMNYIYMLTKNDKLNKESTKDLMKLFTSKLFSKYPKSIRLLLKKVLKLQLKNKKYSNHFDLCTDIILSYHDRAFIKFIKFNCHELFKSFPKEKQSILNDICSGKFDCEKTSFTFLMINELIRDYKKEIVIIKINGLYLCVNIMNYVSDKYYSRYKNIYDVFYHIHDGLDMDVARMYGFPEYDHADTCYTAFCNRRNIEQLETLELLIESFPDCEHIKTFINKYVSLAIDYAKKAYEQNHESLIKKVFSYPFDIESSIISEIVMFLSQNTKYVHLCLPFLEKNELTIKSLLSNFKFETCIKKSLEIMVNSDINFALISFLKFIIDLLNDEIWNKVWKYGDKYTDYKNYINSVYKRLKSIELRFRLLGWRSAFIVNEED